MKEIKKKKIEIIVPIKDLIKVQSFQQVQECVLNLLKRFFFAIFLNLCCNSKRQYKQVLWFFIVLFTNYSYYSLLFASLSIFIFIIIFNFFFFVCCFLIKNHFIFLVFSVSSIVIVVFSYFLYNYCHYFHCHYHCCHYRSHFVLLVF